jgi:tetratricopeptide (TPR) repeat protein
MADIVHGMLRSTEKKDYQTMADVVADLEPLVNPPPKTKGVLGRAVLLSCFILLTLTSAAYYAEAVHLIDIPGVSFPLTRQQQTTIPEDIRKMDYDLQFKEALKAEKNPETYGLAYRIFDHIEMNSDMPAQREKAGYYKACIAFFRLENYHVAIRDFKQLLRTYPESQYVARASLYLGDSYLKINKIDKAISHFQYVYLGFPDNEIRETTHLFLQKAREKLKNQGHDIGFVSTSTIGKFLPNNRVGLSLMVLQMMLFVVTPIYWRQIFRWLGKGSGGTGNLFGSGRKFLWLLVISIVILSIIVLTNYLTHQQIYQNSVDTIEKMYGHFSRWQLQAGCLV